MLNTTKSKIVFGSLAFLVCVLSFVVGYYVFSYEFNKEEPQYYTITLVGKYGTYYDTNIKDGSYYSPAPELPQYPDNNYATISVKFRGWYKDAAYTHLWLSGEDKITCDMYLYAKWS